MKNKKTSNQKKTIVSAQDIADGLNNGFTKRQLIEKYGARVHTLRTKLNKKYKLEKIFPNPKKIPFSTKDCNRILNETKCIGLTAVLLNYATLIIKEQLAERGWKISVYWSVKK